MSKIAWYDSERYLKALERLCDGLPEEFKTQDRLYEFQNICYDLGVEDEKERIIKEIIFGGK